MERRWVRSEGMDSQGMSRLCDKKTSYGEGMYTRVYIYICIDISSWCILPRLKVEHIITHLDRYGVDCKKKQWENQMSRHQVKRRQDILHVSQVFCWAPPLISPSNHPMQKVEIQWKNSKSPKKNDILWFLEFNSFHVDPKRELIGCFSTSTTAWLSAGFITHDAASPLPSMWSSKYVAWTRVLPEGLPGPWFCPSSGHDADPCPVTMGFEMEDPGNWIDHCTSKIVRALIFFFWKVCFLLGCGLSIVDVWMFAVDVVEGLAFFGQRVTSKKHKDYPVFSRKKIRWAEFSLVHY